MVSKALEGSPIELELHDGKTVAGIFQNSTYYLRKHGTGFQHGNTFIGYTPQTYQSFQAAKITRVIDGHAGLVLQRRLLNDPGSLCGVLGKNGLAASFTSGCDPEFFAFDARGEVIPAFEFLPKTGRAFWDGFQAEI